jgi:hypothetical protein
MRELIVSNLISLDGYASGPGSDVMALPFDTTFSDYNLELIQAADTLVSGATTYRGLLSYWPPVADDPAQPEVERAISRRHRELLHLVISDTLTAEETGPWRENTTIVRRDEARDAIAQASSSTSPAASRPFQVVMLPNANSGPPSPFLTPTATSSLPPRALWSTGSWTRSSPPG